MASITAQDTAQDPVATAQDTAQDPVATAQEAFKQLTRELSAVITLLSCTQTACKDTESSYNAFMTACKSCPVSFKPTSADIAEALLFADPNLKAFLAKHKHFAIPTKGNPTKEEMLKDTWKYSNAVHLFKIHKRTMEASNVYKKAAEKVAEESAKTADEAIACTAAAIAAANLEGEFELLELVIRERAAFATVLAAFAAATDKAAKAADEAMMYTTAAASAKAADEAMMCTTAAASAKAADEAEELAVHKQAAASVAFAAVVDCGNIDKIFKEFGIVETITCNRTVFADTVASGNLLNIFRMVETSAIYAANAFAANPSASAKRSAEDHAKRPTKRHAEDSVHTGAANNFIRSKGLVASEPVVSNADAKTE